MNKTKVFISYSHQDEHYRQELEKHLSILKRNGDIDTWTDRKIIVGENWEGKISTELLNAQIILLLISPDFLASDYCYDVEMKTAIERHNNKEAIVVPIILRHCDWSDTPFSSIQGLPINAIPVKEWNDQDKAFLNVVDGIKVLLKSLNEIGFISENNGKDELSKIRKKVLSAKTERELKAAKFELNEYQKIFPLTFEISELANFINKSILYYGLPSGKVLQGTVLSRGNMVEPMDGLNRNRGCLKCILIIIFIAIITTIIYLIVR